MAVRIRLARFGCRNRPFYRVVAADSRSPRDGKHLEILGFYNPLAPKDSDRRMSVKADRVKYWLSVGGQPSDTVRMILFRLGVELPQRAKSKPRKDRPRKAPSVDPPLEGCFLALKDPDAENEGSNEDGEKLYID